ncbi:MAG: TRAP transporter small permease subunit [Pseudomonadota bacterium]
MDALLIASVRAVERIVGTIGRSTSLVLPLIVVVIVVNVVARYGFGLGLIELEELQWHLNALVVMGCLAYAYRDNAHVRVDIIHSALSQRGKAIIEIMGGLVLLLPFVLGIAWFAWHSFAYSFSIAERSPMPSGLPARYVVKFIVFAGFALLAIQGLAVIVRAGFALRGRRIPPAGPDAPA